MRYRLRTLMIVLGWISTVFACLPINGCGTNTTNTAYYLEETATIDGKVILEPIGSAEGSALAGCKVEFHPQERNLRGIGEGTIERDGTFTIETYGKEGASIGRQRVSLTPGSDIRDKWRVKFANQSEGEKFVEIKPGVNKIILLLKLVPARSTTGESEPTAKD